MIGAGYPFQLIMSFTLKQAVSFGTLASVRRKAEISVQSSATRMAVNAEKKTFNKWLDTLEDDDG